MELIRISDKKMKIMLTPADMSQYELSSEAIGEDSEQVHRAFRVLFEDIRRQTGFALDDRQISVQYFPSREGGCEMFISTIAPCPTTEEKKRTLFIKNSRALITKPEKQQERHFKKECAFRFETLDLLLLACKRLDASQYVVESDAFGDSNNKHYYLLIKVFSDSPFALPEEIGFLSEYGNPENVSLLKIYIQEHGKVICNQKAVEKLASLV